MPLHQLSRINLNLLICLQALLEEQSVSRAARRLCVSQSAVSKHLGQLRQITKDPLFTRTAHGLNPTPRALKIHEELGPLLKKLLRVVEPEEFNPATCSNYFHIALPEPVAHLFFKWCLPSILHAAPNIKIKVQTLTLDVLHNLSSGKVDFALIPHDIDCAQNQIAGLHCQRLHQDNLVCLIRNHHPCLDKEWNIDAWLKLNHISIGSVTRGSPTVDNALVKRDRERQIVVAAENFHSATSICESTDLALVAPNLWALYAREKYEVSALPIPLSMEPVTYELYWHDRNHQSKAHQWLRRYSLKQAKASGLRAGSNRIHRSQAAFDNSFSIG